MLTEGDRSQIRRDLVVAVLGIIIGVLTTFFNKILESEYQFQRNVKVLEYNDDCDPDTSIATPNTYAVVCNLKLQAAGLKEIKQVHLAVTAISSQPAQVLEVSTAGFTPGPEFAPPDPPAEFQSNKNIPNYAGVLISRLRAPQQVIWTVKIKSRLPIDIKQIQRTVTTKDDQARIEEGSGWRWKRWIPLAMISVLIPAVVICLLLIIVWKFRPTEERRTIIWE